MAALIIGAGTSLGILAQPWSGATSLDADGMMSGLAFMRPLVDSICIALSMGIDPDESCCFSCPRTLISASGFCEPTLRYSSACATWSKYATSAVCTAPSVTIAITPTPRMMSMRG